MPPTRLFHYHSPVNKTGEFKEDKEMPSQPYLLLVQQGIDIFFPTNYQNKKGQGKAYTICSHATLPPNIIKHRF